MVLKSGSEITNTVVPIEAIKPHPDNYNFHPEAQLRQLEASYEELGQFRSVVLWQQTDGSYIQLAGHGIVEAMKREGATEVRADVLPHTLDSMTAKRILLADNLHAKNSSPDDELLAALLVEQKNAGFDLASLGYDEEALRQMLEALGDEMLGSDDESGDGEEMSGGGAQGKGSLLALLDVTLAEPRHEVHTGDIWTLGKKHTLLCVHVFKDWPLWAPYLRGEQTLFLPFPGPMVALSDKGESHTLVLVQPDPYIAGHLLDRYADIHGESSVRKLETVAASLDDDEEEDIEEEDEEGDEEA